MLADSIPAAHVALTETSAHPVSKSSFKRRLHDPALTQKRARDGTGRGTLAETGSRNVRWGHKRQNSH
jgi:hypothetical protein